jgi:hypothetical protein
VTIRYPDPVTVHLEDCNGRQLEEMTDARNPVLDISHLQPGIYFIRVNTGNKMFVEKLMKL